MKLTYKVQKTLIWRIFFGRLSSRSALVVIRAYLEFLIGDDSRGLKHYPKYKYVTRAAAYGRTFFSAAQRGYVMALLARKNFVMAPSRTMQIREGWVIVGVSEKSMKAENRAPGVGFTMGDTTRSRHEKLVGWQRVRDVIWTNQIGSLRAAKTALHNLIGSLKPR